MSALINEGVRIRTAKNASDPAFPNGAGDHGLTIRDWLAANAPQRRDLAIGEVKALIGEPRRLADDDYRGRLIRDAQIDAAYRYLWADAMLAERSKQ